MTLSRETTDITRFLRPETDLERRLLTLPEFEEGLFWGEPRFGHPEGQVIFHIREVLENIDRLPRRFAVFRERLRLITFAHDTFKYKEDKSSPRDWTRHHGILARQFLAPICADRAVLDILELHDEAYYCWRIFHLQQMPVAGLQSLDRLMDKIAGCRQLYYLFFRCDTMTGDKTQAPLKWFERTVGEIDLV